MLPLLITFQLLLLLLSAALAEETSCPCLTTDNGALDSYKSGGQLYYDLIPYPNDYGTAGCRAYDTDPSALQPFCADINGPRADAPSWCLDSFCYVDPNNCDFHTTLTGIFPESGLHYSYQTCGGESTFDSWFGVNGTAASAFTLDDLADVVEAYIKSLRTDIEASYQEYASLSSSCDHSHTGCPCADCVVTPGWGGAGVDFDATMLVPHATTPVTSRTTCLSQTMHSYFMKIAGAEYHDTSQFANLYAGFQEDGASSFYPEFSWCPTDYDPRFRPWYSTAATNPKLIIVVLDVSGSMLFDNRIDLARDAALAVLDTLTWNDEVGFILFNNGIEETYPVTACNDANRILMKDWVEAEVTAGGGTNFIVPLEEAFSMIEASSSTACTKAILFLTDGVADFTDDNYNYVIEKAETNQVILFTYALGADADTTIAHKLACDNSGIFYRVADGADLSEVMSSYYSYFAASISYIGARWILYDDFATGTELLSACTPMYDTSDDTAEIAVLIGVICMDINMIADVSRLKAHSQWDDLYNRVLATSLGCSESWVGISTEYKLTILEELRMNNAGNGAEVCNNEINNDDDSSSSFPIIIPIIIGSVLAVMVCLGALFHQKQKMDKVAPEAEAAKKTAAAVAPPAAGIQQHQQQKQQTHTQPVVRVHIQQPQPQPQPQPLQQPPFVQLQPQQPPVVRVLLPQQQQQQQQQQQPQNPQYIQPQIQPQAQPMVVRLPQQQQPQQQHFQHQQHHQQQQQKVSWIRYQRKG